MTTTRRRRKLGFPLALIFDEVARRLRTQPVATFACAMFACVLGAGGVLAMNYGASQVQTAWDQQIAQGSATYVVASQVRGEISAARCDALNSVTGVDAAGGVLSVRRSNTQTQPDDFVYIETVTPRYPAVVYPGLSAHAQRTSAVIGTDLATAMGLSDGATLASGEISVLIQRAPTASLRVPEVDRRVLISAAPAGSLETCVVSADAGHAESLESLLTGWFPLSAPAVVTPMAQDTTDGTAGDLSVMAWLLSATTCVALAATASGWLWAQRAEFALYRSLGLSRLGVVVACALQLAMWFSLPAAVGAAVVVGTSAIAQQVEFPLHVQLAVAFALPAAVWLALPIGYVANSRHSIMDAVKGR
ncbi:hypothetical protein [Cellulomonas endometrii]|uniref:hypothetical protein n=1 Tax=Cellulomonas endometrii TaxID=3036301 RepID=UPI0024ADD72C|nr:hypothetical protein [Cellulomonas endometrii]